MRFDILTLFPHILDSYVNESILKRAQAKKLIIVKTHNIRDYATDKHHTTDDSPYGGGAGMVMKVEPIYRALHAIKALSHPTSPRLRGAGKSKANCRTILLAANGKFFTQRDVPRLGKYKRLVFICGRYEGVDERVKKFVDETISIGPYVLTGGELPAAIIIDAVARHIPGVLGNEESPKDESFSNLKSYQLQATSSLEYPQYTRPAVFVAAGKRYAVPKVLLSGDHNKIKDWRAQQRKVTRH